eukprot:scaffold24027_cov60-Phaeocystis_antarctica.AAC.3
MLCVSAGDGVCVASVGRASILVGGASQQRPNAVHVEKAQRVGHRDILHYQRQYSGPASPWECRHGTEPQRTPEEAQEPSWGTAQGSLQISSARSRQVTPQAAPRFGHQSAAWAALAGHAGSAFDMMGAERVR